MSEVEIQKAGSYISLRKSVGIYVSLLVLMIILLVLSSRLSWFPGIIPFIAYFACGFILNRIVLRRLIEWHPLYNTLANVSGAKISSFLMWPLAYFILFFRLTINKIL
ncbi:hypothetical protein [Pantoea sp. BAV 3049]|uniref:hypothetical protein n=1 Tax=Pantoea sp. BAV 3049 TaxID=2654188 RepID=UPI00131A76DE|nr:hypothetical protein [Pantoea sp. BAV 3049]